MTFVTNDKCHEPSDDIPIWQKRTRPSNTLCVMPGSVRSWVSPFVQAGSIDASRSLARARFGHRHRPAPPIGRDGFRLLCMAVVRPAAAVSSPFTDIYRGATVFVIALGIAHPLRWLYLFFAVPIDPDRGAYAVFAMALYLPLELYLLVSATRATRLPQPRQIIGMGNGPAPRDASSNPLELTSAPATRRQWWLLVAMAFVTVVPLPVLGTGWLGAAYMLGALVLVSLRRPWSFIVFGAIVVGAGVAASALGHPEWTSYFILGIPLVGLPMAIVVGLIRTARELEMLRLEMADEAVVRERVRIADELQATVVKALDGVAQRGDLARETIDTDSAATAEQLRNMVDAARSTLADARRLIRRYQSGPLDFELEATVRLLAAAGIETRMALPPGESNLVLDAVERAALRKQVVDLLTGPPPPSGVNITIIPVGDRAHVEIQHEDASQPLAGTTGR
jgi:two-component system, NarL family, sensor histidine kinase DesK